MTRDEQVAEVARHLRIKADACARLGERDESLNSRNWSGLSAELNDAAWSLEELAAGRDVAAIVQGCINRNRMSSGRTMKDVGN